VQLAVAYLPNSACVHLLTDTDAMLILTVFEFLAETVQGPCSVNQEILAKSAISSVVQSLLEFTAHIEYRSDTKSNHSWRGKYGLRVDTLKRLRVGGLGLLLSLLEGRPPAPADPVFALMVNSFDFSAIPERLSGVIVEKNKSQVYLRRKFVAEAVQQRIEGRVLEEGFLLLALGHQVAAYSDQVARGLVPVLSAPVKRSKFPSEAEFNEADRARRVLERVVRDVMFFNERLRSVEIAWGGLGLFRFYFTLPNECYYLTEESKRGIIQDIDFGDDDRVKFFVGKTNAIHDDVSHQQTLQNDFVFILLMRFQDELDYATAALAILINFILIISLQKGYLTGHSDPVYEPKEYEGAVQVLVIAQFIVLLYKLLQTSILSLPLIYKDSRRVSDELAYAQANSSDTAGKRTSDLMFSFGPFVVVSIVCFIIAVLINQRYTRVPYPILALLALILAKVFVTGLDRFARSSWNSKLGYGMGPLLIALTRSMDDGELQYRSLCAVIGVLALNVNKPYFSSLMLLVIVKLSITLQNVVRAVTLPRVALFLSSVLGLIMIFIFAIFGFYLFPNDFYNEMQYTDECSTLLLCLTTFLHGGLLSGGGIADHISGDLGHAPIFADSELYASRITYDVFFFVIIIVLLLNIIFGIIIDTFGKLREDASEKKRLQNDFCFICGISRDIFEATGHDKGEGANANANANDANASGGMRSASGRDGKSAFTRHIKEDHNMWNYIFFLIYLKTKNSNNYFGIESYVAAKAKQEDVSWIPRGAALVIPDTQGEEQHAAEERMMGQIRAIMEATQRVLSASMGEQTARLQDENKSTRQQVASALRAVSDVQETLEGIKNTQASLEEAVKLQRKK
jgi:hypothetical protein